MFDRKEIPNKLLKIIKLHGFDQFEAFVQSLTEEQFDIITSNCRFLCRSIQCDQNEISNFLLDKGTTIDRLYKGTTPLHMACENGNVQIVRRLIEMKCNVNIKDSCGKTPLFYAVDLSRIEKCSRKDKNRYDLNEISEQLCKLLIDNGAFINIIGDNTSPLIIAIESENSNMIKYFFKFKLQLNRRFKNGKQIVHFAAEHSDLEIFQIIINHGLNINDVDNDGKTSLHYAASNGNKQIVKYLIKCKNLIDSCDKLLKTPLYCAVENNRLEIVETLLRNGADANIKDKFGWTPLHLASRWKNEDIFDVLLKYTNIEGFKINGSKIKINLEDTDCTGSNALHHAVFSGRLTIVKKLLELNADINAQNNDGLTPLHIAVKSKLDDIKITTLLLENDCKVNSKCILGNTPLHYAVSNLNISENTINLILEYGGDLNALNYQKNTPLEVILNLPQTNLYKRNSALLHALKLSALHRPLDNKVKQIIDKHIIKNFPKFNKDCHKEIALMKEITTQKDISIIKILTLPIDKLVHYFKNDNVMKYFTCGSYKLKFPIYSNLIESMILQVVQRKNNLESVDHFFLNCTEYQLTYDCSEIIFRFLNNRDMKNMGKSLAPHL